MRETPVDFMTLSPENIAMGIGFALSTAAAAFERFKSSKAGDRERKALEQKALADQQHSVNEQILKARDELTKLERDRADAFKVKSEDEHAEFLAYQKYVHGQNETTNAKMLRLTEENARLSNLTDLSPIVSTQKEMMALVVKQGEIMDALMRSVKALLPPQREGG